MRLGLWGGPFHGEILNNVSDPPPIAIFMSSDLKFDPPLLAGSDADFRFTASQTTYLYPVYRVSGVPFAPWLAIYPGSFPPDSLFRAVTDENPPK